jgi:hypothetical protein
LRLEEKNNGVRVTTLTPLFVGLASIALLSRVRNCTVKYLIPACVYWFLANLSFNY